MTYYSLDDNGVITQATTDEKVALSLRLNLTTQEEIVHGYDGKLYIKSQEPQQPIEQQNETIRNTRASLYSSLIDPLHAEKFRRSILNEWTPELEAEYVQKVTDLTTEIKTNNPYIERKEDDHGM